MNTIEEFGACVKLLGLKEAQRLLTQKTSKTPLETSLVQAGFDAISAWIS